MPHSPEAPCPPTSLPKRPGVRGESIDPMVSCAFPHGELVFRISEEGDLRALQAFLYIEDYTPVKGSSDRIEIHQGPDVISEGRMSWPSGVWRFDRTVLPDRYEVHILASGREIVLPGVNIW
jgi:hypothetical protein